MGDPAALTKLLSALKARGYCFVTPTPPTCRRMADRAVEHPTLRDIFGWSRTFAEGDLEADLMIPLKEAGFLLARADGFASAVRVSTVHGELFLHSAFPPEGDQAVFLGPDTYRFADLIVSEFPAGGVRKIVDIGTGAGVGGIVAARCATGTAQAVLADINPLALTLARANAACAGVEVHCHQAPGMDGLPDGFDLIVANPPYIAGESDHAYKDGGGQHGAEMSLDWARQGVSKLAPGGRMILYTGAAIVLGGADPLRMELEKICASAGCGLRYREIDPDVFSEDLRGPGYADVERIAAVGAVIHRP